MKHAGIRISALALSAALSAAGAMTPFAADTVISTADTSSVDDDMQDYDDGLKVFEIDGDDTYRDAWISDVDWDGSKATWTADNQEAARFAVTLFKNGKPYSSLLSDGGNSVDFGADLAAAGNGRFYFMVRASWPGGYGDTVNSNVKLIGVGADRGDSARNDSDTEAKAETKANATETKAAVTETKAVSGDKEHDTGEVKIVSAPGETPAAASETATAETSAAETVAEIVPESAARTGAWEALADGKWSYRFSDGTVPKNRWEEINGNWYCFDPDGVMWAHQWIRNSDDAHIWYFVGDDGALVRNTTIDGWVINERGECYY